MNLSVIVPVYNVEKYIRICIQSVLSQQWEDLMYEIVIVDDASPDNSIQIVKQMQQDNRDIIKIIHQENKGLGGARNTGIENAVGDYLFFLDSDDLLVNNNMPALLRIAIANNLDILEFAASRVDQEYKEIDTIFHVSQDRAVSGQEYSSEIDFANSACNKLYKRKFLTENGIRFFEKTYIEDAPFNSEAFFKANAVMAVDKVPVAYLQNPVSITRQKKDKERQIRFIKDSIKVTSYMNSFISKSTNTNFKKALGSRVSTFVAGLLLQISKAQIPHRDKMAFVSLMKQNGIYPYPALTPELNRKLFLRLMNNKLFLNTAFKVLSKK